MQPLSQHAVHDRQTWLTNVHRKPNLEAPQGIHQLLP